MTLLKCTLYFLLSIFGELIEAVDHVHVSIRYALPVVDDLGGDTTPIGKSVTRVLQGKDKTHQCLYLKL